MTLSKEAIDNHKNICYQKHREEILTFIVKPEGGINKERLQSALNLLLSQKDITDYFAEDVHSVPNGQEGSRLSP